MLWAVGTAAFSQEVPQAASRFVGVSGELQQRLDESLAELSQLRAQLAEEKIPLSRKLNALEEELSGVRRDYQQLSRQLDSRTLDLGNLNAEIKSRRDEKSYVSNLLSEYLRNFESRLHISELQRYRSVMEAARLAPENKSLSDLELYYAQSTLVAASLERLHDALGGARFEGTAVDADGLVKDGAFVLLGPVAVFHSLDGKSSGTAEQRLGSLEPAVIGFQESPLTVAVEQIVRDGQGNFPFDPTLGNAHKMAETRESLWEHISRGGPVMVPIMCMAAAALLVALFKWYRLARVPSISATALRDLLAAVARSDRSTATTLAAAIGGPAGKMLTEGVHHMKEPRELVEEVMYEQILAARLDLNRLLPFIAISASSAPLLGLLGTVTGIMTTFKLITVFGSGDVKMLSGGISEALITTEYGLIVAIPSLLLHAFLSRKARGIIDGMEKAAIALLNQLSKTPFREGDAV
jgi:biopolymer transport protein ExbB